MSDPHKLYLRVGLAMLMCLLIKHGLFAGRASAVEPVGLENLKHFERLPYFKDGTKCWQTSSYSRAGDDYIENFSNREHILLDVKNPGCIYRIWFTEMCCTSANIAIFVDGQPSPIINKEYYSFISNLNFPFVFPLVGSYKQSSGGYYSYLPIPFKKSCRVVANGVLPMFFFNITYHTFTTNEGVEPVDLNMNYEKKELLHQVKKIWDNVGSPPTKNLSDKVIKDTLSLPAGETGTLLELSGAGAITGLKLDISPSTRSVLADCKLRMFWDNEAIPSVDVPLGHFFGSGVGEIDFKSLPIGMSTSGWYYCYFPMPYWKSAKILITNNSSQKIDQLRYEIHYTSKPYEEYKAGYFKTYYNKEHPTSPGKDYTILDTQGRGHFIGVVLTAGGENIGILEGDERIYIDGSTSPQLHGTGAEDYFNGAWYFKHGFFSLPTHGYTAKITKNQPNGKPITYLNCYRFHISDYIPFYSSIKVGIEHGNRNRLQGFYSSVAYYYAVTTPNLILTDEIDIGEKRSEKQHNYVATDYKRLDKISSRYAGEKNRLLTDEGIELGRYSQFKITIIPDNQGIRLRRRTFYGKSPQEARVWVDDNLIGNWYTSPNQIWPIWLETEFEIPAEYTVNKQSVTVKIEPASQKQKWNEFYYWVYVYKSTDKKAPAAISDLKIIQQTGSTVTLSWTTPGDDGYKGNASNYDIRYSTTPIDETIWEISRSVPPSPTPQPAKTKQVLVVRGVRKHIHYYFAIKTLDEAQNISGISNIVSSKPAVN
jgi:hypothetical protein